MVRKPHEIKIKSSTTTIPGVGQAVSFMAECKTCGWTGGWWDTEEQADGDGNDHVIAMSRGED